MPSDATATAADGGSDGAAGCRSAGCACTSNDDCDTACVETRDGNQVCATACSKAAPCGEGQSCELVGNSTVCVDPTLTLCDPCNKQNDCTAPGAAGAACVQTSDGGGRCGLKCAEDTDCPKGFVCADASTTAGAATKQCLPIGGPCGCSARAIAKKLASGCALTNSAGTCVGKRVCEPAGLSDCQGQEPQAEICNGVDDNCNNATDENASCDDLNPCSIDSCSGSKGCAHSDAIEACDDDNACTIDTCDPKSGCGHAPKAECVVGLPYKQAFNCAEQPAWQLSPSVPGQPRWTLDAVPVLGVFTPGYHSAACSLNFNLGTSMQCAQPGTTAESVATSPVFTSAGLAKDAALRMQFWLAGTWRGGLDTLSVEYQGKSDAGWVALKQYAEGGPVGGSWQAEEIALPMPVAAEFRLRLRMVAQDCAAAGNFSGPFIDDVAVRDVKCKTPADCDDGNPCTDDACIPSSKLCNHKTGNTVACSDGNPCTLQDTCKNGVCQGKPALGGVCDDGNPCTINEKCAGGECQGAQLKGPCDDGNPCTSGDNCDQGACAGSPALACDDKNPCTFDLCDVSSGKCAAAPTGESGLCDDGEVCTDLSLCHAGACVARFACDDGNPCTQDYCSGKVCSHFKVAAGIACSDNSACTQNDACDTNATCQGDPAPCGNALVLATGCKGDPAWQLPDAATGEAAWGFWPVPAKLGSGCALGFSNGQGIACSEGGSHVGGQAVRTLDLTKLKRPVLLLQSHAGVAKDPKANLRFVDIADPQTGKVQSLWLTNDDEPPTLWRQLRIDLAAWQGKVVQLRLVFDSVTCQPASAPGWFVRDVRVQAGDDVKACSKPADCDDGDPCSVELCLKSGQCSHVGTAGDCDDGNACTANDQCSSAGNCLGGLAANCDDKNVCTLDACAAASGCSNVARPDGDPCPDGNACTVGDFCVNGSCLNRDKCDDGNPCTKDNCVSGGTCVQDKVNGGAPCDDLNPCTTDDYCSAGTCVGTAVACAVAWQDTVACTDAWTLLPLPSPATVSFAVDATPSPPGFHSGPCSLNVNNGTALPCADDVAGSASATSGPISLKGLKDPAIWLWSWHDVGLSPSQHLRLIEVSADNFATVAIAKWQDNAVGDKSWQKVKISLKGLVADQIAVRFRWAALNCNAQTGKGWFIDDLQLVAAQAAPCKTAADCDDSDICSDDACNPQQGCVHLPNQLTCSDGDACTTGDQCWKGSCLAKPKDCEDGNNCTLDSCDSAAGCSSVKKVDGSKCDDGDSCSGPDGCVNGACSGPASTANGSPCTSANACQLSQTCNAGKCGGGKAMGEGSPCDDNDSCTNQSACTGGTCKGTVANLCDDLEACTLDACFQTLDGPAACTHAPLADAVACDDGDPCTEKTVCLAGACEGPQVASCVTYIGSNFDTGVQPNDWDLEAVAGGIGWMVDALPQPPTPHSPPYTLNYNNNKNTDNGVPVKGAFTLPAWLVPLQGAPQLTFWSWHDGEISANKDKRTVEISYSGSPAVQEVVQLPNHIRRGLWSHIRIALTKHAGKAVLLKFRYETVDQFDNEAPGWFIDDLRAQSAQPAKCGNDGECAQPKDPCKPTKCVASVCVPTPLLGDCDDGDACTVQTTCQNGACLGVPTDCDDGYACSLDVCDKTLGCFHKTVDNCGIVNLPYDATFTCGIPANTFWLRDTPIAKGAPAWFIDASPPVPPPLSPDCSLNFNDGDNIACPDGVQSMEALVQSPQFNFGPFKIGTPLKARVNIAGLWQPGQGESLAVEAQEVGAKTWVPLGQPSPSTTWQVSEFDLTPWAGKIMRMRFKFASQCNPAAGQGSGPFLDDIKVFDASCKSAATCSDGNPCTEDTCDVSSGLCKFGGIGGPPCDDGNPCTLKDACASGQCLGTAKPCDDGDACTADSCDPASGQCASSPLPDGAPCNDGQSCTTGDACTAKICKGKAKSDGSPCSDGNPCTLDDACATGVCTFGSFEADGAPCTDGNPCTAADSCASGKCKGGKNACDDGDPCTDDVCTPVGSVGKSCLNKKICP